MKIVAWGFSVPGLSEVFAREVARVPGRTDLLLQIDPDVRTIDFSSVRIAEFLRMEHTQIEILLRVLEKDHNVTVVFDAWRFVFSEAFEACLDPMLRVAKRAGRCLFLCPRRVGHPTEFPLSSKNGRPPLGAKESALFETWSRRIRTLHESVVNAEPHVRLVVSPPPVEAFWGLLGSNALVPAKTLGFNAAPLEARTRPAAFGSFANLAREAVLLLSADAKRGGSPWTESPRAVDVSWPEGVRAFDCPWTDWVAKLTSRGVANPASLPAYATPDLRGTLARYFFAQAALAAQSPAPDAMPAGLGVLFPSHASGAST